MGRKGLVVSVVVAVGAVASVPAFSQAANSGSFSAVQYGDELSLILGYLPLVVALFAVVFVGREITR